MKIKKIESHEIGHIVRKKLNQTCCQSVATADRRHRKNKLSPFTRMRRRSAIQISCENLRLDDYGRSFVIQAAEVINNNVMDVIFEILLSSSRVNGSRVLTRDPRDPRRFVDPFDP